MSDDETLVTVKIYVENGVRLNPPKIVRIERKDLRLDEGARQYKTSRPQNPPAWSFGRLKDDL